MKYFYIIDNKGTVWGSFDTVEIAKSFGDSLDIGYRLMDYII
jgi:hypothetical protein